MMYAQCYLEYIYSVGLDNALRVFAIHKDVQMNMELSQGNGWICQLCVSVVLTLFVQHMYMYV